MTDKILVIGGVAAGTRGASQAKKMRNKIEIMIENLTAIPL